MATGNHLTIKDYFDQVLIGSNGKRGTISSVKSDGSGNGMFHRILTSFENPRFDRDNLRPTGLTVVDYLNNPVRIKCQFNHRLTATPPEKKEAKADKSPGSSANISAAESTAANTEPSGLGKSPPEQTDSSSSPADGTGSNASLIIEKSIHQAACKYNLPPGLIKAVIRAESNFQVGAVSAAGAQGLMQLMPATARELGVEDPFDIAQNIDGGARYLRQMLDNFGGDVKVALAAYNAGPGTVEKYGGQIPPYQQTERYINRVLKFSQQMA